MRVVVNSLRSSSLARNAGWMFGGQVMSYIVQACYFVLLARLLGIKEYGVLAGAAALTAAISQFSAMGSGLLFLRYVSPEHSRFREYWGNIVLSVAGAGTLLVLALRWSGTWLLGPSGATVLLILGISDCICGQLTIAAAQVFQAFEKMRITASLNFLTNLLRLVMAAGMAIHFHRATALMWAFASFTVSAVACVVAIVQVTRHFGLPRFRFRLLIARLGEGFVFAISGSTTVVYNDIDKIMLGHYGMTVANGIYFMAYRVVNICMMPVSSIHAAAFPRFFREGGMHGVKATEPFARKLLKRTVILGSAAAAGMFLFAPLLPMLIGRDFHAAAPALQWLCLIPVFRCFHLSAGDAIAGAGFQRYRFVSQFVAAAGNFCLNLWLIPKYSWQGAAWASLLTDGSLAVFNWAILKWLLIRANPGSNDERPSPALLDNAEISEAV